MSHDQQTVSLEQLITDGCHLAEMQKFVPAMQAFAIAASIGGTPELLECGASYIERAQAADAGPIQMTLLNCAAFAVRPVAGLSPIAAYMLGCIIECSLDAVRANKELAPDKRALLLQKMPIDAMNYFGAAAAMPGTTPNENLARAHAAQKLLDYGRAGVVRPAIGSMKSQDFRPS